MTIIIILTIIIPINSLENISPLFTFYDTIVEHLILIGKPKNLKFD